MSEYCKVCEKIIPAPNAAMAINPDAVCKGHSMPPQLPPGAAFPKPPAPPANDAGTLSIIEKWRKLAATLSTKLKYDAGYRSALESCADELEQGRLPMSGTKENSHEPAKSGASSFYSAPSSLAPSVRTEEWNLGYTAGEQSAWAQAIERAAQIAQEYGESTRPGDAFINTDEQRRCYKAGVLTATSRIVKAIKAEREAKVLGIKGE